MYQKDTQIIFHCGEKCTRKSFYLLQSHPNRWLFCCLENFKVEIVDLWLTCIYKAAILILIQTAGETAGDSKMAKVTLQESGYQIEITDEMLKEMSQYGDVPGDWGSSVEDVVWVSVDYARNDPHWDVPEGYPDYLPLWEER